MAKQLIVKSPTAVKPSTKPNLAFDPTVFLKTEGRGRTIGRYSKDQPIFSQGGTADVLFYIISGTVKIVVHSELGKEAVIALLGQDDFFGEGCLAGQSHRLSAASAITDSDILRITKPAALKALREHPALSEMFVAHIVARTIRVEADLIDQLFNSSEKRLARALLLLANFGNDGKPQRVIAKVSQEMLADMIGTTRSRVSHFMNKFRKMGFIDYNGHLVINSSLLNVVLHDQPHIAGVKSVEGEVEGKGALKSL
ncbi:Crp/Fnr family transcriptional regulator [Bradyrhizobium aeschynomenes]|uniref:Crp/Fnr family transcriptional regulator n=1 Tax=Bradyrhizobium aeschynomenes TaxID=2734909 RepID=UPI00155623FD|nr:Crp/Fnr family transcriptional regulator [Bradyrhizobium aeschynomenes]NPV21763.1 Crp/Fnr family transcriptional regulator [Bradyrhizobium aeschynomenes]